MLGYRGSPWTILDICFGEVGLLGGCVSNRGDSLGKRGSPYKILRHCDGEVDEVGRGEGEEEEDGTGDDAPDMGTTGDPPGVDLEVLILGVDELTVRKLIELSLVIFSLGLGIVIHS